jgi:hypothetical protein
VHHLFSDGDTVTSPERNHLSGRRRAIALLLLAGLALLAWFTMDAGAVFHARLPGGSRFDVPVRVVPVVVLALSAFRIWIAGQRAKLEK